MGIGGRHTREITGWMVDINLFGWIYEWLRSEGCVERCLQLSSLTTLLSSNSKTYTDTGTEKKLDSNTTEHMVTVSIRQALTMYCICFMIFIFFTKRVVGWSGNIIEILIIWFDISKIILRKPVCATKFLNLALLCVKWTCKQTKKHLHAV